MSMAVSSRTAVRNVNFLSIKEKLDIVNQWKLFKVFLAQKSVKTWHLNMVVWKQNSSKESVIEQQSRKQD